jgi:putative methyltransferase
MKQRKKKTSVAARAGLVGSQGDRSRNKIKAKPVDKVSSRGKGVKTPTQSLSRRTQGRRQLTAKSEILRQAAYAVSRLIQADVTGKHGVSLKSLTLGSNVKQKKAVYAVTVETLKYYWVLERISKESGLYDESEDNNAMSLATSCVLVKEVVLGAGISRSWVGQAEKLVLAREDILKRCLEDLKKEKGVRDVSGLLPQNDVMVAAGLRRRTARVNAPLRARSLTAVKEVLERDFGSVTVNKYVKDVLELDPGVDMHSHPLVADGSIVLQSLASCLPAVVLDPEPSWRVIDACAAPGNKTTHVASLMAKKKMENLVANEKNGRNDELTGCVYAFDRDPRRLERLKANVRATGSSEIIIPRCIDFLKVDPKEYSDVDAVLLDPSCSGSGTSVSRMDYLLPSSQEVMNRGVMYKDDRVEQLSQFQVAAIKHAMSFPRVKKIVYSTCSIYVEENERVVSRVLDGGAALGFKLVTCLPSWKRRGIAADDMLSHEDAKKVVRVDPLLDGTDGFFVASWERQ